jgi:hypothetical protein
MDETRPVFWMSEEGALAYARAPARCDVEEIAQHCSSIRFPERSRSKSNRATGIRTCCWTKADIFGKGPSRMGQVVQAGW